MPLDLSDDYLAVDLAEPVTITSRATAPGSHSESIEVSHAFRGKLSYRELMASSGAAIRMEATFDVPKTLTPGYTWKPGDTITDQDDNTYNIWSSEVDPGTAFWRFIVYNPKIAYDLRHTVDWYDHQMEKDASGAAYSLSEDLIYSAISSRVQWQSAAPADYAGRSGEERRAFIHSSERLYLSSTAIAKWTDPDADTLYTFDIVQVTQTERLDQLMIIEVVARP